MSGLAAHSRIAGKHVNLQYLQIGECRDMESEQRQCMTKLSVWYNERCLMFDIFGVA